MVDWGVSKNYEMLHERHGGGRSLDGGVFLVNVRVGEVASRG
jgi:hypothetical protein